MFHEVSLRGRLDDLETHPLVEREGRIDAQDPQTERQLYASGLREQALDQVRPDPAPLVLREDEKLRQPDAVLFPFDHLDPDRGAVQLEDLRRAGCDVLGRASADALLIPCAERRDYVFADRLTRNTVRKLDVLRRCEAEGYALSGRPVDYIARKLVETGSDRVAIELAARDQAEVQLILFTLCRPASASRPAVDRLQLPFYRRDRAVVRLLQVHRVHFCARGGQ